MDPIGLAGGENLYGIANNIQKFIDPLGLMPILIGSGTSAGVIGSGSIIGGSNSSIDVNAPLITDNEIKGMANVLTYVVTYGVTKNVSLANEISKVGSCSRAPECPPCKTISGKIVFVGTIGYRLDQVPPSKPHYPYTGDHYHLYKANQNPNNCQCFWGKYGMLDATKGEIPPIDAIPAETFQ